MSGVSSFCSCWCCAMHADAVLRMVLLRSYFARAVVLCDTKAVRCLLAICAVVCSDCLVLMNETVRAYCAEAVSPLLCCAIPVWVISCTVHGTQKRFCCFAFGVVFSSNRTGLGAADDEPLPWF